jgi:[acyl-carrier-protein] S-malonyltransferase
MSKIAFIFPGQGSQAVGMGMDAADKFPAAKKVFDTADRVLGFSISGLIRQGPEEELKLTINTQPAVVATSIALLEVLRERGIECLATAGHSVGEFAALYCAGVLTLEDCFGLTRARGEYMHESGEKYPGTLAAVIGLDTDKLEEVCRRVSEETGIVVVANLNCPGQTVISGELKAIEKAGEKALEAGASRVMPLPVSAAFHSPLMDEAAEKLARKLDSVEFSDVRFPVYANVTGEPVTSGEQIRELMKKQITSRVSWEKSIRRMMEDGISEFVEIGPGNALAGMLRRIDRKLSVHNCSSVDSLEKVLEKMTNTTTV